MKNVAIVGCGSYMSTGYGCPGEWRCLKAAAMGEGKFAEPVKVVAFHTCHCPGRNTAPNIGMAVKISEVKPDAVYLSSCLANARPGCPYTTPQEMAEVITAKTGLPVILGTHDYH
ncbi:MAG: CGGC domain-containing protein [Thermodesulfobacteriota bacterium]